MKITFCLAVGLVTGIMLPLRSNASENQVPQTPVVAPINSIQTSPQSSPTGFNERLSDTSKPSESVNGSGKSTETLSDTSKPDSESVTPDKAEENTETPMTTSPTPTGASESKKNTTETITPSTGGSSPMGQMNNINGSPAVIKDGQMPQKPDDDKVADPSSSSKPTSSNTTPPNTTSPNITSPTTISPNTTSPNITSPTTTSPNTTSPNTTPKTNKTTKTVPRVKTGEW